jgi:hypothetical protein
MAVLAVSCELVRRQIPVNREKYREFTNWNGIPFRLCPVFMGVSAFFGRFCRYLNREFFDG